MKHEAHGTQQPRHISMIGEGASTAQRSDSLVQSINQRFLRTSDIKHSLAYPLGEMHILKDLYFT